MSKAVGVIIAIVLVIVIIVVVVAAVAASKSPIAPGASVKLKAADGTFLEVSAAGAVSMGPTGTAFALGPPGSGSTLPLTTGVILNLFDKATSKYLNSIETDTKCMALTAATATGWDFRAAASTDPGIPLRHGVTYLLHPTGNACGHGDNLQNSMQITGASNAATVWTLVAG